jgi:hypothetical protein
MTSPTQLTLPPQRIQRRRVRGWRLPAGARIVDRTTRFGNPFTIADAEAEGYTYPQLACVELHAAWLDGEGPSVYVVKGRRFDRNWVLAHLPELRGLELACPCPPGTPCHADTLIARANRPARKPLSHGAGPKPYAWPARGFAPLVDVTPIGGLL